MTLSVVIPTLGQSPHLRGLLERLQRQRVEFLFEVLVVANIPQQQLRTLVNSMGTNSFVSFVYLETGRLGVNFARNKGLERAQGDIVLFLDDDMILEDDSFLAEHVALHQQSDAIAVGGPYKLLGARTIWDSVYQEIAHDWLKRQATEGQGTTQLLGGNASFKKSILLSKGWSFDEVISFGGAETGLCMRIATSGGKMLLAPQLEVGHAPQMRMRTFLKKAYLQGAGAKWRDDNLPQLPIVFASAFLPDRTRRSRTHRLAVRLYELCFQFGYRNNPYTGIAPTGAPLQAGLFGFGCFILRELKMFRWMRNFHRRIYASIRTAWLNGAIARSSETPR